MKQLRWTFLLVIFFSCRKENHKPFDQPFIHIMENNISSSTVNYEASVIRSYTVYLSSKPLNENLEVTYEVKAGNGLKENVDFEILNKDRILIFLQGIYDMPIRIRWIPSPSFDPQKDNTVTIRLLNNSKGFSLGLPGPDQLQKEFVIKKVQ